MEIHAHPVAGAGFTAGEFDDVVDTRAKIGVNVAQGEYRRGNRVVDVAGKNGLSGQNLHPVKGDGETILGIDEGSALRGGV